MVAVLEEDGASDGLSPAVVVHVYTCVPLAPPGHQVPQFVTIVTFVCMQGLVARARHTIQEVDNHGHSKLETIIWGTQDMEPMSRDVSFIHAHIAPVLTHLVHPMVRFWCLLCSAAKLPLRGAMAAQHTLDCARVSCTTFQVPKAIADLFCVLHTA